MGEATTQLWARVPRDRKRQVLDLASQYEVPISDVVNRALDYYFTEKVGMDPILPITLP